MEGENGREPFGLDDQASSKCAFRDAKRSDRSLQGSYAEVTTIGGGRVGNGMQVAVGNEACWLTIPITKKVFHRRYLPQRIYVVSSSSSLSSSVSTFPSYQQVVCVCVSFDQILLTFFFTLKLSLI